MIPRLTWVKAGADIFWHAKATGRRPVAQGQRRSESERQVNRSIFDLERPCPRFG
jgi:hypothetical protein